MNGLHILPGNYAARPTDRRVRPGYELRERESDTAYFSRRAAEEHAFAETLNNARSKSLHLEIARRYTELSLAIRAAEDARGER